MEMPNSIYDDTHTWQNANDRVEYERAFTEGNQSRRKEAMALITADRNTPEEMIRERLTIPGTPPRFGYEKNDAPTLDDVLMVTPPDPGTYPTDFSGSYGEYSGSSVPTNEWF
jgi:hypothetical protein